VTQSVVFDGALHVCVCVSVCVCVCSILVVTQCSWAMLVSEVNLLLVLWSHKVYVASFPYLGMIGSVKDVYFLVPFHVKGRTSGL